ncbi:putative acetyl-CoA carboxylase [Helianthus anomalus]
MWVLFQFCDDLSYKVLWKACFVNDVPLKHLVVPCGLQVKGLKYNGKSKESEETRIPDLWSLDPDPNVKGGVVSHLSSFKHFKEKPKLVTLEFEKPLMNFEKPLMNLQKITIDVQKMANETGLDFSDQVTFTGF